jgi:murein L,D-transpeptidase YafK
VIKHKRRLIVFSKGEKLKTYKIALSKNPKGKKRFEGDMKTPEGIYFINDKNPNSGYHKNLGISYPNNSDIEYSRKHNQSPGGLIKIHGLKNGYGFIGKFHRITNWTLGCIAMTNMEVDELYENVAIGTEIEIVE